MTLAHVSEKPWSDYTSADYSIEQWHRACLVHQHADSPTSKDQCKLPVRTPSGAVNRNGVHAAAAALAGARGGVQASPAEQASARTALVRLYQELDEKPPPSLLAHSGLDALAHYGIRGMRWGTRRSRVEIDSSPDAPEHVRARDLHTVAKTAGIRKLSNRELQELTQRLNLEQQYTRLTTTEKGKSAVGIGSDWVGARMKTVGNALFDEIAKSHARKYALGKGIIPQSK